MDHPLETLALSFQNKREKGGQKSSGKPPERESHLSLFSLAAAMETVENRKRVTHRSHSLRSPSFPSLAFSLYKGKCPFSIPKTHSCHDEQMAACQYGKEKQTAHRRFYPQKKPRSMTKKKPSTTLMAWCWAFSDYSDFQWVKQCSACKQLFRILLLGVKMYCSAKSYAQKRTAYTLSCFAF